MTSYLPVTIDGSEILPEAPRSHTYQSDGVFELSVRTATDRWSTEVAVNFPPYGDEAPA
jgi:hypothetical protein